MIHFLSQNISSKQATAIGLLAVALWSFVISLIRSLSLHMGAVGGAAMMYTLSTVLIWLIFGRPHLRNYNRSYLFWASVFFLSAANCVCRCRLACTKRKTGGGIGMVNYLADVYHRRGGIFQQTAVRMVDSHRLCAVVLGLPLYWAAMSACRFPVFTKMSASIPAAISWHL